MSDKKIRHVLGLSGGKDSSALAIFMRDKVPQMEYFFTDTGAELPETYEYLDKLEAYLGKPIARINATRTFDHLLKNQYNNFLPSPNTRWCTRELKIRPFEEFAGDDVVVSYVGIRADEDREGYVSTKPNIKAVFPFKEAGLVYADIMRILNDSGLGIPAYYEWRSRSGCYFCFFQRKSEWVGLKERHPQLFEDAKQYEKFDPETGTRYTWSQGESLDELEIRAEAIKQNASQKLKSISAVSWQDKLAIIAEEEVDESCLICSL
ncbi:phosphoadenosine phosphosulfate reductase family protein [Nitrosomonas sp.]|jgi:3'-phosphoadenosine 5'-phosphosulfate sulfotransferase (PAPS reductase)/FAD synthetase|uniref:phosphoadenosine phosphosulfate reductase family protein n=1 Tax=Nitrosomonas sp. TaxID=42353 RepID=UPI0025F9C9BC|nr:phosphoadenosine phosphosulfate reductase family protein [Nitrosomonas sp.]MBY0484649.1 phosphoadenosine phosphosulfate reductase family protein [Nitrosomonas sp.]